jgi:fructose-specific phosphotransferase system IIA component
MNIREFLQERAVSVELKVGAQATKADIIEQLVGLLVSAGAIRDKDVSRLVQTLLNREALGSTGIGQGVAIPHGKTDTVSKLIGALAVCRQGVKFDSLDGEPVYLFFLLVAPEDSAGPHLKALARISRLLKDKHFRDSLRTAKDASTLLKTIFDEDERRH